jgi:hypothetical protein
MRRDLCFEIVEIEITKDADTEPRVCGSRRFLRYRHIAFCLPCDTMCCQSTEKSVALPMTNAKQVVYYYDGNQAKPDVEPDLLGNVLVPANGSLITRHGKSWKVARVIEDLASDGRLPVFKVFLATPQSS